MDQQLIIESLRQIIKSELSPLIGEKVILLDCPYHINIGDTLIWQGEIDFLNSIGKSPLLQSSLFTFPFPSIEKQITICLHGGGNFGDLYRNAQEFRKKVITKYPNNRIIMFPQSIWYENTSLIQDDVKVFSEHKDLILCARDRKSFVFLKQYFYNNKILLIPDMAFYITELSLKRMNEEQSNTTVLIKRLDKELNNDIKINMEMVNEVRDWPTFEKMPIKFYVISYLAQIMLRCPYTRRLLGHITDVIMHDYIRKGLIKKGVSFLDKYSIIYTTRLHAMILGTLLGKKIIAIDNISNKLSDFYNTWLFSNENISLYNSAQR